MDAKKVINATSSTHIHAYTQQMQKTVEMKGVKDSTSVETKRDWVRISKKGAKQKLLQ